MVEKGRIKRKKKVPNIEREKRERERSEELFFFFFFKTLRRITEINRKIKRRKIGTDIRKIFSFIRAVDNDVDIVTAKVNITWVYTAQHELARSGGTKKKKNGKKITLSLYKEKTKSFAVCFFLKLKNRGLKKKKNLLSQLKRFKKFFFTILCRKPRRESHQCMSVHHLLFASKRSLFFFFFFFWLRLLKWNEGGVGNKKLSGKKKKKKKKKKKQAWGAQKIANIFFFKVRRCKFAISSNTVLFLRNHVYIYRSNPKISSFRQLWF